MRPVTGPTRSVIFAVETSLADLASLVGRFESDRSLSSKGADKLRASLKKVDRFLERGQQWQAVKELEKFVSIAADAKEVPNLEVGAVLARVAEAVLEGLSDPQEER
ncbi:MAG TPA: hypothetical protein VFX61_14585 [Micromonosporaceae bacterium]|nr:hypothetical protein [Micromonosporaceae bacterium]